MSCFEMVLQITEINNLMTAQPQLIDAKHQLGLLLSLGEHICIYYNSYICCLFDLVLCDALTSIFIK